MKLSREFTFAGDELAILTAMDNCGCVMTADGGFYCDLDNEKMAIPSRLPVRVRGIYQQAEAGWRIHVRLVPAPRTVVLGVVFLVLLFVSLLMGTQAGNSWTGAVLFAILIAAVILNFATQYETSLRRFEAAFRMGMA